jgi:hypothetical protein
MRRLERARYDSDDAQLAEMSTESVSRKRHGAIHAVGPPGKAVHIGRKREERSR